MSAYNDRVEDYHDRLDAWRAQAGDAPPLPVLEAIDARRRDAPDKAWCWADI